MKLHLADRSVSLQRIVERQLRNWEIQSNQKHEDALRRPFLLDFIALSRQTGCNCEKLAEELGRRLEWKVYDHQLIDMMAGDEQYRRHVYSTLDERQSNWIDGLLILCAPETNARPNDYVHQLCKTLLTIAHHENAIFVGRGAHRMLPPDVGLRVHATANHDFRVANMVADFSISREQAEYEIKQADLKRRAYLNKELGIDPDNQDHYDLTLNMARLTVEQAASIVVTAIKQKTAAEE